MRHYTRGSLLHSDERSAVTKSQFPHEVGKIEAGNGSGAGVLDDVRKTDRIDGYGSIALGVRGIDGCDFPNDPCGGLDGFIAEYVETDLFLRVLIVAIHLDGLDDGRHGIGLALQPITSHRIKNLAAHPRGVRHPSSLTLGNDVSTASIENLDAFDLRVSIQCIVKFLDDKSPK